MEWDLINYFSEKLYIEHKKPESYPQHRFHKRKSVFFKGAPNSKNNHEWNRKRKIILVKSQLTLTIPPTQYPVERYIPSPFLTAPTSVKSKWGENNFLKPISGNGELWKFLPKCQKAWKLKFIEKRGWGLSTLLVMVSFHSWIGLDVKELGLFRRQFRFINPDHF